MRRTAQLITLIGVIASCIGIFVFLTGLENVGAILKALRSGERIVVIVPTDTNGAQQVAEASAPFVSTKTSIPQATAVPTEIVQALEPTVTPTDTPEPTGTPLPEPTTLPPVSRSGRIFFQSDRDSPTTYMINADGSGVTRLTPITSKRLDTSLPAASPDGQRIAFLSLQYGNQVLFLMDVDGWNLAPVIPVAGDSRPAWSPDGQRIAFTFVDDLQIYLLTDLTDRSSWTRVTSGNIVAQHPAWSPDGQRIAFDRFTNGNRAIHVINIDGSNEMRLVENGTSPAWSPDGQRIAFASKKDGNFDIYVINADGTNETRLTSDPASEGAPCWSPDGQWIAYITEQDNYERDLYVMNVDGTHQTRLTTGLQSGGPTCVR